METLNYSRRDAARQLQKSESTIDVMIRGKLLKIVRQGRRIMIPATEIERVARQPLPSIWPPKQNGKTTRHFAPVEKVLAEGVHKKGPVKASLNFDTDVVEAFAS